MIRLLNIVILYFFILPFIPAQNNVFKFKITGNNYSDETVIRMVNGATNNFDGNYDAWKLFSPNQNVPSMYTQISPGLELSINAIPEITIDTSVTIYTNIPTTGTYLITIEQLYPISSNYKVSFTDIASNTDFYLANDTSIQFTINAQQNAPTFTFNISTLPIITLLNETCLGANDGSITINKQGNNNWITNIYDSLNNIILSDTLLTNIKTFNNLPKGNYMANLFSKGINDTIYFNIVNGVSVTSNFNMSDDTVYIDEGGIVSLTNTSQNAQSYYWNFGDGNSALNEHPSHNYSSTGSFQITLLSTNQQCTKSSIKNITVDSTRNLTTEINDLEQQEAIFSRTNNLDYKLILPFKGNKNITIYTINGALIHQNSTYKNEYIFSMKNYASNIYIINITSDNKTIFQQKFYH